MRRRALSAMACAVCLPLLVGLTVARSYAQGAHPKRAALPTIRGIVLDTGNAALEVQTQSGTIIVPLYGGTQVIRLVFGSSADLTPGAQVDIQGAPDSTIAQSITILPPAPPSRVRSQPRGLRSPSGNPSHRWKPPEHATPVTSSRAHTTPSDQTGQIIALNGKNLSVRDERGRTVTYTLSDRTKINKLVRGAPGDLATGQMVMVERTDTGAAALIEILTT